MTQTNDLSALLPALCALMAGILAPTPGSALQFPPPEEMARMAAEAEAAPLFASEEPLVLHLFTDLEFLKDERPDEEEIAALIRFRDEDGDWRDERAEVRTRGIFRREARNCSFPPIRLDVPTGRMEGTVFHGQDKLKLVMPCREGRGNFQALVLKEYLAYRMLNVLTPFSFRVRLVDLTVHDTSGDNDPIRQVGFAIEDDEALAARNRAVVSEWERFSPGGMDVPQASLVSVFQYMIGNTDWSAVEFHNAILLWDDQGRYLTVPYDFDFSGIVEAPYATPDPRLGIRTVRDRLYRGFCWPEADYEGLNRTFTEKRPELEALWHGLEVLENGDRDRGLDYLELFYRIVEVPGSWRRQVVERCRGWSEGGD